MLKNYKRLISLDLENNITEHFFFVDFFNLIKDRNINEKIGYSNSKWKNFYGINKIRNKIAHPVRSLLDDKNTIDKLSERLKKVDELLFKLKNE